ncbi:mas-related G-protein coupled receptor member E-like [Sylvia atricapilla]|uniref:mas-related G-protein coupled receptor member E-like n=1 Tax=Sylvia atricapilla TaxID=48155 RepID=UPI0033939EA3
MPDGIGEWLVIFALSPSCYSPGRSHFRIWIPKEHEVPGSAADLHRPPLPAAAPLGTGAAEEPHGPSRDSPGTDSPSTLTTARGHIPLPAQRPSMEVTTVSPSPASATEGDDLCEIDVTNVAIHSVTLLISLCGLLGNGAVLGLLRLKVPNIGIFDLAFADFLFLLFTVPSTLLFLVEDVFCSPIMPLLYPHFLFQFSVVSYYWALFQLTRSTSEVTMFKLCCCCKLPLRLMWLMFSIRFWSFFAHFTLIPAVTNLCPSHQQEDCRAALIPVYAIILLLFAAPVVISSTIDFVKAKRGSKKHQPKRRDIVVFLTVLFILLIGLCNFLQDLGIIVVSSQVLFLLNCIQSSMKPFIYFLAGGFPRPCSLGSLRSSLQRVFDEQKGKAARIKNAPMDTGV